jgi:glycolate oxidase iron-sulfur subunit
LRHLLGFILPRPGLFRQALLGSRLGKPLARWMPAQFRVLLALAAARQQRCPVGDRDGGRLGRSEGGRSPTVGRPNRRHGFSPGL